MKSNTLIMLLWLAVANKVAAADYYVAPAGDDANAGSILQPFRTVQRAADVMKAGDTCYIRAGRYRETVTPPRSGRSGLPIRFQAYQNEIVIFDGTDLIHENWERDQDSIFRTPIHDAVTQVFVAGRMMTEARWPNGNFEQRWDRSVWAESGVGSRKDTLICAELDETGIDWTGALAVLNVGHQFKTWTRTITTYDAESSTLYYALEERLGNGNDPGPHWEDDYFYLMGKREALDSPGEWFHDVDTGTLYFYPENGDKPARNTVSSKKRNFAFDVRNRDYIELHGLEFFAATFQFVDSDHNLVTDCRLRFPTYTRRLTDSDPRAIKKSSPATLMQGKHNTIRNTGLMYTNARSLVVLGSDNVIENCIVHDTNWAGSLSYPSIQINASGDETCNSRISRCTVSQTGNAGITYRGGNNIVEYCHVYDVGLLCRDISAVHTGSPRAAGSVARYNWIHGAPEKGLRGDDQTRRLTFHHNVLWDVGQGLIIKGDNNKVFNNTILGEGKDGILLIPTRTEPQKWWTPNPLLQIQNVNSLFYNNAVATIGYRHDPLPPSDNLTHNLELTPAQQMQYLMDPAGFDFRPKAGSPLIDAGRVVPGYTDGYVGAAPDLGAYEFGGKRWTAGADWEM